MFNVIYQGPHGQTVASDDPKLDAYKQMAYLQKCGTGYRLTAQADGSYTVAGDGLEPITFEPRKADPPAVGA